MKITLRQIEIFINVAQEQHLTNVAKRLGLSQSAVSMSLKELENIIGRPLFDRVGKRLILNEVGRSFYKEVSPLYRKMADIEYEFKNTKDRGSIRVGASTTIIDYIMPNIACQFMNRYPKVNIFLKDGNSKSIAELVKMGKLDMGFIEGVIEDRELIQEVVGEDELIIVSSSSKFTSRIWRVEELLEKRWIMREEGSGTRLIFLNYLNSRIENAKSLINIVMELERTEAIKNLLLNGDALSCMSYLAVSEELATGRLNRVQVEDFYCKRELFVAYRKDKYKSELFNNFLDFAKDKMTQILHNKEQGGCINNQV